MSIIVLVEAEDLRVGWDAQTVEVIIDLGSLRNITEVSVHAISDPTSQIVFPTQIEVSTSKDKSQWEKAASPITLISSMSIIVLVEAEDLRVGWDAQTVEVIIDLGSLRNITEVSVHAISDPTSQIVFPTQIEVSTSKDKSQWEKAASPITYSDSNGKSDA